jgi:hypothetical protein
MRFTARLFTGALLLALTLSLTQATAQQQPASGPTGTFLLTIFLKHDQSRPLEALNEQLRTQKYYETFPPQGIEVVSWYVMMGIGQVVTLRVPGDRLREVNRAIERTAWGAYRTEFYPTYDLKPVMEAEIRKARQGQ